MQQELHEGFAADFAGIWFQQPRRRQPPNRGMHFGCAHPERFRERSIGFVSRRESEFEPDDDVLRLNHAPFANSEYACVISTRSSTFTPISDQVDQHDIRPREIFLPQRTHIRINQSLAPFFWQHRRNRERPRRWQRRSLADKFQNVFDTPDSVRKFRVKQNDFH
jgi:hypothetical protein